jgi:hypothetical protein
MKMLLLAMLFSWRRAFHHLIFLNGLNKILNGADGRNRTPGLLITSQLLYLLSYASNTVEIKTSTELTSGGPPLFLIV